METSQSLATESFSYGWLSNVKPSLDGLHEPLRASLDNSHEASSKKLDYRMPKSKKFLGEAQNFNFDIPISQSPDALAHADELFSNGRIKPIPVNQSKIETSSTSDYIPATTGSSFSMRTSVPAIWIRCRFLGRWRKSSEQILLQCFGCLRPSCHKVGGSRKNTRVDDIDRRACEIRSWSNSPQASPQRSMADSTVESSIYEAVLHCKRSIGK